MNAIPFPTADARMLAIIEACQLRPRDGMRGGLDVFVHHYDSWQCPLRMAMETLCGWHRLGRVAEFGYDVASIKRGKLRKAIRLLEMAAERMEAGCA